MKSKNSNLLKKLAFIFFVLGLASIVFLMFEENKRISNLAGINAAFLSKLQMQDQLLKLETQADSSDAMLKELFVSGNSQQGKVARQKIEVSRTGLRDFSTNYEIAGLSTEVSALHSLLVEKVERQYQAIDAFANNKLGIARQLISSEKNTDLRERIAAASGLMARLQKKATLDMAESTRINGQNAYQWSITLSIATSIFCLLVCIYLLNRKRRSEISEKKVRIAAKIKENFLSNMSHEIRTPLNAILGFTNILNRTRLDEQQQQHVQIIQASGNNLLAIVNDILDLSKIEAGMMRIESAPFRVTDVMATVEQMLSPKANEKNIKLIVKVDEDVPETLSGDAVRLTQVLVNLVSNAIKFTLEGGVYVKVTPFKKEGDKITLEFLVRDTGVGIPKDKQHYIFDRFEQAEAETTRRFGGTGLGLSIVKHLIDLQKGKISLSSQEGAGSIFLVEIPYQLTNLSAPVITQEQKATIELAVAANVRILVAEDNILNQHLVRSLFKTWGFEFDMVFNGVQAIEALKKNKYDMVLMDIQMPEMDGHTATQQIRQVLKSTIPVIAMTAHAMEGQKEKCLNSGMNDYLSKPINEDILLAMINKYTNGKTRVKKEVVKQEISPVTKSGSVISLDYIDRVAESDSEFKKQILREFVKRVPGNIQHLEEAIEEKNYSKIYKIAHDMKTTIHFMGLSALIGDVLQSVSDLASTKGAISTIRQNFADIKSVCLQAVNEASRLVA